MTQKVKFNWIGTRQSSFGALSELSEALVSFATVGSELSDVVSNVINVLNCRGPNNKWLHKPSTNW